MEQNRRKIVFVIPRKKKETATLIYNIKLLRLVLEKRYASLNSLQQEFQLEYLTNAEYDYNIYNIYWLQHILLTED